MEGWSRSRTGARTCLPIATVAESPARENERSIQRMWGRCLTRNALPNARVDAGVKSIPVNGEVCLDSSLYGRNFNPAFLRFKVRVWDICQPELPQPDVQSQPILTR